MTIIRSYILSMLNNDAFIISAFILDFFLVLFFIQIMKITE